VRQDLLVPRWACSRCTLWRRLDCRPVTCLRPPPPSPLPLRYCECFASGRYCDGCNCINCHNNREHEATRQAAVEAILERNPNAFRPKIAGGVRAAGAAVAGCVCVFVHTERGRRLLL
jgi:hypothetical protein